MSMRWKKINDKRRMVRGWTERENWSATRSVEERENIAFPGQVWENDVMLPRGIMRSKHESYPRSSNPG